MVKNRLLIAVAACGVIAAMNVALAEEGESLPHSGADINNIESLQRGARNYVNYCSGCHSMKYVRYNRMADDLKIPEAELKGNLMLSPNAKAFDTITNAMPPDSEAWFGKVPPDLSLMARARGGVDYIYAFLKGFYVDKTRVWGVNNLVLPGAAMPDVVAGLQGLQKPVYKSESDEHGGSNMVLTGVAAMTPGSLTPEEYDQFARDTANFLDYAAEPVKAKRQSMGIFVTLFLLVFFVFALMLKKEYWKDVH
jgi:ubiquinol-cytochrome c reductase cytochrome c1 subunit